jgi:hypothetical protein
MRVRLPGHVTYLLTCMLVLGWCAWSAADDIESTHQLSLADLANYRVALTGKPTAADAKSSDPATRVVFKDLWNRPEAFSGRRVVIKGRVERIFRQGPVGSFPALAEIWLVSSTSDPFCVVVPQERATAHSPVNDQNHEPDNTVQKLPKLGQMVEFTGTFLKVVRFAAGDGDRLAPLVVGDQPPVPAQDAANANGRRSGAAKDLGSWPAELPGTWLVGLTLALVMVGALASRYLRFQAQRTELQNRRRKATASLGGDPPLEFVEPDNRPG